MTVLKIRRATRRTRRVTYQLELIRCGSKRWNCHCKQPGGGHGPYWFAYWRHVGRKRKRYIGVTLKLLTFEQLRTTERERSKRKQARKKHEKEADHGGGTEGGGGAIGEARGKGARSVEG